MIDATIVASRVSFALSLGLRAAQLIRGCTPRVIRCATLPLTSQHEIPERKHHSVDGLRGAAGDVMTVEVSRSAVREARDKMSLQ
jgi:hypothetical protein